MLAPDREFVAIMSHMSQLRTLKVAKVLQWSADRARGAWKAMLWRGKRLRWMTYELFPMHGKLPPGSLSTRCAREAQTDDRFYLRQRARYGKVFKLYWGSGDLKVCLVDFALARRVFREHSAVLRPIPLDITSLVPADYLRGMAPAIHPHYRSLFTGALRNDVIASAEAEVRHLIRDQLDGLTRSRAGASPAAALRHALNEIATRALLRIVLGVGAGHDDFPALAEAYGRMAPDGYIAPVGPAQREAFQDIRRIVLGIVERLRPAPNEASADSVVGRLAEVCPESIDDTVIGNCIYLVERGRHDLCDLMRWMVKLLSDHPEALARLRERIGAGRTSSALAEACVLETMRLEQAEVIIRRAREPFSLEGFHIPEGTYVCALMRETHRDPVVFPDPDSFRPERFTERQYSTDEYSPFGIDEHRCIARTLVLRTGTMLVEELVGAYSWTVAGDGPRSFGPYLWHPSREFAIDLRRRERHPA